MVLPLTWALPCSLSVPHYNQNQMPVLVTAPKKIILCSRQIKKLGLGRHEQAKAELKSVMPEDAKEAIGHGIRAKRSKIGAVSFDLMTPDPELSNAAV
jgi:hypothetical protein